MLADVQVYFSLYRMAIAGNGGSREIAGTKKASSYSGCK
jgi:hypothetical protein